MIRFNSLCNLYFADKNQFCFTKFCFTVFKYLTAINLIFITVYQDICTTVLPNHFVYSWRFTMQIIHYINLLFSTY